MKNQKICDKGQSAMEYLMTYGWAIVIITTAAIVMWQLGIFSLGSSTGPGYSGFGEVDLAGFSHKENGTFECVLTNNARGNITITQVKVIPTYGGGCSDPTNVDLTSGQSEKFSISGCQPGSQGDQYRILLVVNFTDTSIEPNVPHTSAGKAWGYYE